MLTTSEVGEETKAAIFYWTTQNFGDMQNYLTGTTSGESGIAKKCGLIRSFLQNKRIKEKTYVVRGISEPEAVYYEQLLSEGKDDKTFTTKSFFSACGCPITEISGDGERERETKTGMGYRRISSLGEKAIWMKPIGRALQFMERDCLLLICLPEQTRASEIRQYSSIPLEHEVLIDKDVKLKITGKTKLNLAREEEKKDPIQKRILSLLCLDINFDKPVYLAEALP